MLQINLSYTFTSKKQTNKHSRGARTLAVCARTCLAPFGVRVEGPARCLFILGWVGW